jgi:hypothetical protein
MDADDMTDVTAATVWRRFHGAWVADIVTTAPNVYRVAVLNTTSGLTRALPIVYKRLEAAKAGADDFVRKTFGHRCTMDVCGCWMPWLCET